MTPSLFHATGLIAAFVLALPGAAFGQAGADSGRATSLRVIGGAGAVYMHLPAFTYTRGVQRTPVFEEAQEGAGLTLTGGLEALRGRFIGGARYQFAADPMTDNWYAHVGAVYGGVARRRPASVFSAALGATVVHREQVTRQFAPGLCVYSGCEVANRVNRDGGTITTAGVLLTVAAERRFGGVFGVGVEGFAATGPQRYAGAMLRVSLGHR